MNKVIVFDFDGTLTYEDTLLRYFVFVGEDKRMLRARVLLYLVMMLLRRLLLVDLKGVKSVGVKLFLNVKDDVLAKRSVEFARTIRFNSLYANEFQQMKANDRVIVTSGSLDAYLKHVFPDVDLICSTLTYRNHIPKGIDFHCYAAEKAKSLMEKGIIRIDSLFTDSLSDLPLARMASKIFLVDGDCKTECRSVEEYITACRMKKRNLFQKLRSAVALGID